MPELINTVAILSGGILGIFVAYSLVSSLLPAAKEPLLNRFACTALFALAGLYTIQFPIEIMDGVIGDTRGAVLVAATLFGGWLPGLASGLAMAGLRLVAGGPGAQAGVIGIAVELLVLLLISQAAWRHYLPQLSLRLLLLAALLVAILEAGSLLLIAPTDLGLRLFRENGLALALLQFSTALTLGLLLKFQDERERLLGDLREKHRDMAYQAHHDPLTGLGNRRMLLQALSEAIDPGASATKPLALLFLDVDQFRRVNDALGHGLGDRLLQTLGQRIEAVVSSKIGDRGLTARVGGDEFVVLIHPLEQQEAAELADALLAAIGTPLQITPHEFRLTASIGISLFPRDANDAESLMQSADAAMYCAKERGRNTRVFYTNAMTSEAHQRMLLAEDLRKALEQRDLIQFYQPLMDLRTGQLAGLEALARWHHPPKGMVSPEVFVSVAEESGLIAQLGQWALETACLQARIWLDAGLVFGRMSVNISALELARGDLVERVEQALSMAQLSPRYLELEITETAIMEENAETRRVLDSLRTHGIAISIDDFGTGYSSLARLRRLPADTLKLDRSFVAGLPEDTHDVAMARCIIAMGAIMGFTVLAEGVETGEQRDFLLACGCNEAQGYFFGAAMPAAEITALLESSTAGARG